MNYGGMESVLKATTKHKEGRTLEQIHDQYRKANNPAMRIGSVLVVLSRLVVKGCVERPSKGRYRVTGTPYSSHQGKRRTKESKYVAALKSLGGRASPIQIVTHLNHNSKRKTALASALVYLYRLKVKGLIEEQKQGIFKIPDATTEKM